MSQARCRATCLPAARSRPGTKSTTGTHQLPCSDCCVRCCLWQSLPACGCLGQTWKRFPCTDWLPVPRHWQGQAASCRRSSHGRTCPPAARVPADVMRCKGPSHPPTEQRRSHRCGHGRNLQLAGLSHPARPGSGRSGRRFLPTGGSACVLEQPGLGRGIHPDRAPLRVRWGGESFGLQPRPGVGCGWTALASRQRGDDIPAGERGLNDSATDVVCSAQHQDSHAPTLPPDAGTGKRPYADRGPASKESSGVAGIVGGAEAPPDLRPADRQPLRSPESRSAVFQS